MPAQILHQHYRLQLGFLVVSLARRKVLLMALGSICASVELLIACLLLFCFTRMKDPNSWIFDLFDFVLSWQQGYKYVRMMAIHQSFISERKQTFDNSKQTNKQNQPTKNNKHIWSIYFLCFFERSSDAGWCFHHTF